MPETPSAVSQLNGIEFSSDEEEAMRIRGIMEGVSDASGMMTDIDTPWVWE